MFASKSDLCVSFKSTTMFFVGGNTVKFRYTGLEAYGQPFLSGRSVQYILMLKGRNNFP